MNGFKVMMDQTAFAKNKGLLLAVLSAAGFSAKAIFVKLGFGYHASAEALLMLRMLFALPFFIIMAWVCIRQGALRRMGRQETVAVIILGLCGYYLASLFDFIGLQYISSGLERLLLFLYPTVVLLISVLFLGKRYPQRVWLAVLLAYAGAALALQHDLAAAKANEQVWTGVAWVGASMLVYAVYVAGSGEWLARIGATAFAAFASLVACIAVMLHFGLTSAWSSLILPPQVYIIALAMALFSTVFPVWALSQAIRLLGAGRAASVSTLGPVLTLFMGWSILGESLSGLQLAGAALTIGGVVLIARSGQPGEKTTGHCTARLGARQSECA
ncbi:EamA family transporter [Neisseriaceae bacterium B2N2-7]|uniref:EamA family transporter n=2 Tax=Craterilacuibacter sinensis TaxID=2686017 RepID=A0A845BMH0_9NEIS|nr:EamA family transporter [Craterilacuibacter sinensis]